VGSSSSAARTLGSVLALCVLRNISVESLTNTQVTVDLDPQTKGLFNLITYVDNNQEEYYMYTLQDESSSSVFVSLDISGQIKLNVWLQADQSWQTVYAQPADPCTPPATSGPFTV
jgi:hypothetical protein